MRRLHLTRSVLFLALAGCFPSIPEGTLRCDDDADCPASFECRADQRCWLPTTDAGHDAGEVDASTQDAGTDGGTDAGDLDAGMDGGTDAMVVPPEDCDNGVDDDSDALVDCADTADCAARVCVPAAPAGWNGPHAAVDGPTATAPACSGDSPNQTFVGSRLPMAAPVTCSGCVTQPPPANQIGCCFRGALTRYSAAGCAGSPTGMGTPAYDGQGTCSDVIGGAASVRVEFEACPPTGSLNGGVGCQLVAGSTPSTTPPVTWQNVGRLCGAPASPAAGCVANSLCLPRPPAGFSQKMCVWHAGDVACEGTSYTARTVYFSGATDTRSCSACTAGQVNGSITCTANIGSCADACCDSGPYGTYTPSGTGSVCVTPDAGHQDLYWGRTIATAVSAGSCTAPGGGQPVGGVTPNLATATTVCCLP